MTHDCQESPRSRARDPHRHGQFASSRIGLGPKASRGTQLLWERIAERGLTLGALGRLLGRRGAAGIARVAYGDTAPSPKLLESMRVVLAIPVRAFFEPAEAAYAEAA